MTDLVACLSTGKGTWGHVGRLINEQEWNSIFLITNEFGKENFSNEKNAEFIVIDQNASVKDIKNTIESNLKGKIKDTEIALNLVSGTGKEHMAIISAVLKLGLGIRLTALTKEGIEEL